MMAPSETSIFSLSKYGIDVKKLWRNASPSVLYEVALRAERGTAISSSGALICDSQPKTGRSPKDKRIVRHLDSENDIWWGNINIPIKEQTYDINRERAIDYLNTREQLFVVDGFAGASASNRLKVRIICTRAYHALFMHNMLIRPSSIELLEFGEPDFVIFNAGEFPANQHTAQMTSKTSVALSFERRELVILGTEYAGEMKKGVFTLMNYLMPKKGVLSMHCSANEGKNGDVTLFFGLSGTGKTTLSADVSRDLIGDDEHCWNDDGIFNIEGGCYAKCIGLSESKEPEIWRAIKYGAILENVVYDQYSRVVDYGDSSITENTRCAYPIEFIKNAKVSGKGNPPKNIIFLSCDAFGVLPPISRLSREQAMYHFISGYTSKLAGTEVGTVSPEATFSACFGAAFIVWHPGKYAALLAKRIQESNATVWLLNTGWTGGGYGEGERISLKYTRAIIDAIHDGSLSEAEFTEEPVFGFEIPTSCKNVPVGLLDPKKTWADEQRYEESRRELASRFRTNFIQYEKGVAPEVVLAGPRG